VTLETPRNIRTECNCTDRTVFWPASTEGNIC